MLFKREDLTKEERITLFDKTIDLSIRRMRAEKKTLMTVPTEEELQALWDEEITLEDIKEVEAEKL